MNQRAATEAGVGGLGGMGALLYHCNILDYGPQPLLTCGSVYFSTDTHTEVDVKHHVYLHISPRLAYLHWLPIGSRIQYKLASLCYNCLNFTAPVYLIELLKVYKPTHEQCSSSDTSFFVFARLVRGLFPCLTVCLEQSP